MHIAYVTHTRFPTEKAHGKQIAEVCSAMAALGHQVTLVCPRMHNTIVVSAHEYYNLPENFEVRYLHHVDGSVQWWIPGLFRFAVSMFFYRHVLKKFLHTHRYDALYARSVQLIPKLVRFGMPLYAELHTIPQRRGKALVKALNACAKVVCLTTAMKQEVVAMGVQDDKIIVEGDGVLLSRFPGQDSPADVRSQLGIPADAKVVGYVGSLVTRNTIEKGVGELVEAIALARKQNPNILGLIVGGPPHWKLQYLKHARRLGLTDRDVFFFDRVAPKDVPSLLGACDVLAYPAPKSDHPYFQRDTSPLKLFEYLAARKPIVCAGIPPVRDAVDEESVYFAEPGEPESFAEAIEQALSENPEQAEARQKKQQELATWYSWQNRMQRILG